jgi:hypothetical protein
MAHRAACEVVYGHNFDPNELRMMSGLISSPSQSEPTINAPQNVVLVGHNSQKGF